MVAANKFVEMNMCMTGAANAHQFQQQLQSFVQRVAAMARLPESDVLVVPWINFAAPTLYTSLQAKVITECAGMCLNRSDNNLGLVLLPVPQGKGVYTYRMEHSVLEKLAGCNVLAERSFAPRFEKSADAITKRS